MDEISPIIDDTTFASMIGKGSFVVGTTACFFFTFFDNNGYLFDPSNINATITDINGSTVETIDAADKLELGTYILNWDIPSSTNSGKYTITLTYTVETSSGPEDRNFSEDFVVGESGIGFVKYRQISSRNFLESLIHECQNIPVYHEPAILNKNRNLAKLTFPMWNQNSRVTILINNQVKESGFSVDYVNGQITFDNALSSYDQILVSYNFRWFTDEDLDSFVEQGINMFNLWPPQSVYNVSNIPDRFLIVGLHGAAVLALRRLLIGLIYQQPAKVYGSLQRAQEVHSMLMDQKKNYEDWLKTMLEQKKYGPYPSTRTITVPEYTLPGGRCLSRYSTISYKILGNEEILNSSIENIYELFQLGCKIFVQSDDGGSVCFELISKIWPSGEKELLHIETDSGHFIDVSEDHIMFRPDAEVPASKLIEGDMLCVLKENKICTSKIKQISRLPAETTFDVEIPSTENLFVNSIKCHNSRWFRYLFK